MDTRRKMLGRLLSGGALLALSACQAPPVAHKEPWTQEQEAVMRSYGFAPGEQGWELQMTGKLLFDLNSDRLEGPQKDSIVRMGRALWDAGIRHLRVEGHADESGTDAYNDALSLRRAQIVAEQLQSGQFPPGSIAVHGWGSSRPLVVEKGKSRQRENRRVAIVIPAQQS